MVGLGLGRVGGPHPGRPKRGNRDFPLWVPLWGHSGRYSNILLVYKEKYPQAKRLASSKAPTRRRKAGGARFFLF